VDIHSHLLPGDGARTLEDSLRLSKLYIIWGNPNYNYTTCYRTCLGQHWRTNSGLGKDTVHI
jgi:hypothetical protein